MKDKFNKTKDVMDKFKKKELKGEDGNLVINEDHALDIASGKKKSSKKPTKFKP